MRHTPGPWINHDGLVYGIETRERFSGVSVDLFNAHEYAGDLRDEMMANAILIAAAPEMFTALRRIAKGLIDSDCMMKSPADWHNAFGQLQEIAQHIVNQPDMKKLCDE